MSILDFIVTMGPLLRQHYEIWERDGDEAASKFTESLSERDRQKLRQQMGAYFTDMKQQAELAAWRAAVESQTIFLGFTKN